MSTADGPRATVSDATDEDTVIAFEPDRAGVAGLDAVPGVRLRLATMRGPVHDVLRRAVSSPR